MEYLIFFNSIVDILFYAIRDYLVGYKEFRLKYNYQNFHEITLSFSYFVPF